MAEDAVAPVHAGRRDGLLAAGGQGGDVPEAGLVTPEAVVLGLPLASVGSRAIGLVLDLLIQGVALFMLVFAAGAVAAFQGGWVAVVVFLLAVFAVLFGYPVAFETWWRGRTPGMAVMGLRVVTVEAAPVGVRHAAIRAALGLVDFYVSSGGVAVISALLTRRAQRLGDLAAGTVVIRERRGVSAVSGMQFTVPTGAEGYAARLDVSALDEDDYMAMRSVLVRAQGLPPAVVHPLAADVLEVVGARVTPASPSSMPPIVVLQCLAAAYQQRRRPRADSSISDWIWS